jgi:hypothetical protein
MYETFEGFTKFSLYKEGFDISTLQQEMNLQNSLVDSIKANKRDMKNIYIDISNNIGSYNITKDQLSTNNNIYHYDDKQDPNKIIGYNAPKDIKTAINNDINELKLYQNSIYITGIIACATLLISAILISKK